MAKRTGKAERVRTFMGRLARDARGNTLAIVAAALIPLAGMVGGGIDMSRIYITKTRLQHACDAASLAGRKSMGAGTWGTDDNAAAQLFFNANFISGSYGSNTLTTAFSESGGTVTGVASAWLPMTLTQVIGQSKLKISVTCSSTEQLPNTDVMFVLDTTGSMNCVATNLNCTNNGGVAAVGSKISGLKNAVKCFYESVAQIKTNGTCTGNPSGGVSSSIQMRFGFVPYSSNVNVGYLLSPAYFANSWSYQSREPQFTTATTWNQQSQSSSSKSVSGCSSQGTTTTTTSSDGNTQTVVTTSYQNTGFFFCTGQTQTTTTTVSTKSASQTFNQWHYGKITTNISGLKNGSSWNGTGQGTATFTLPIGSNGTNQTITWDGCIEEAQTVQTTNYTSIPTAANDLNIDLIPTQSDTTTLWKPALEPVIYLRNATSINNTSAVTTADSYATGDYASNGALYTCPTAAKKLQNWSDVTAFDSYVDSLVAQGNTYHDIGILWGARLMSPTGIFASENALAANGGSINRNMIFMTDGDATANACDYNAYGVPWWDQRQTTDVGSASGCNQNYQALIDQINARYAALCTAVKNKGINLYVISYGNGSSTTTETRLSTCASAGSYYKASDPVALNAAFQAIAAKISMLRLTT